MVLGLAVRVPQIRQDLLEQQRPQRLTGRRDEDGEEGLAQARRVDDVLPPQQDEAAHDSLPQLVVEDGMVLCEDGLQVLGELAELVGVAVAYVSKEVDQGREGVDLVRRGARWRGDEDLPLRRVAFVLPLKLILVGSWVSSAFVLHGIVSQDQLQPTRQGRDRERRKSAVLEWLLYLEIRKVGINLLQGGKFSLPHGCNGF